MSSIRGRRKRKRNPYAADGSDSGSDSRSDSPIRKRDRTGDDDFDNISDMAGTGPADRNDITGMIDTVDPAVRTAEWVSAHSPGGSDLRPSRSVDDYRRRRGMGDAESTITAPSVGGDDESTITVSSGGSKGNDDADTIDSDDIDFLMDFDEDDIEIFKGSIEDYDEETEELNDGVGEYFAEAFDSIIRDDIQGPDTTGADRKTDDEARQEEAAGPADDYDDGLSTTSREETAPTNKLKDSDLNSLADYMSTKSDEKNPSEYVKDYISAVNALLGFGEGRPGAAETDESTKALMAAITNTDLPGEYKEGEKLSSENVKALHQLGRALVPYSLHYNPILREAWRRTRKSKDTRTAVGQKWGAAGVDQKSYTGVSGNFPNNVKNVLLEHSITTTGQKGPREALLTDKFLKGQIMVKKWKDTSKYQGFEKHHLVFKEIAPELSISGTNLVAIPKPIHQTTGKNPDDIVKDIIALHKVQDGKGDTKVLIPERTKLILRALKAEGEHQIELFKNKANAAAAAATAAAGAAPTAAPAPVPSTSSAPPPGAPS